MAKKKFALLISPVAKSAYFADYISVAKAELKYSLGVNKCSLERTGALEFLVTSVSEDSESFLSNAMQLSFVMGVFEKTPNGLTPIDSQPSYTLDENFVFGSKYRGKTNEHLTQLLLNLSLASIEEKDYSKIKVLDPMCGRATTLMWALRYGICSKGIERDAQALPEIRQHLKKRCKLHRQKHSLKEGFVNKANKSQSGKFIEFTALDKKQNTEYKTQIICGDAREAHQLLNAEKFQIITSDLPYGLQHTTGDGKRNPIETLNECALSWKQCLKPGGVITLSFNKYIPKRDAIIEAFSSVGLEPSSFEAPHRMSESIVRDIVIFRG